MPASLAQGPAGALLVHSIMAVMPYAGLAIFPLSLSPTLFLSNHNCKNQEPQHTQIPFKKNQNQPKKSKKKGQTRAETTAQNYRTREG